MAKFLLLFVCFFYGMLPITHADPALGVKLYQGIDRVFYCDFQLQQDSKDIYQTLKAGISVRFSWHLRIEEVRDYWWNRELATLHISRQVIPDLVSRGWTLIDQANGISRRVSDIEHAVSFLMSFHKVPVVDQSLLDADESYLLLIELQSHEGASNPDTGSWFNNPPNTIVMHELLLQ